MPGLSDTVINGGDMITRAPDGREIVDRVSLTRTINGASVSLRSTTNEYPAFIVLNERGTKLRNAQQEAEITLAGEGSGAVV